jgi:4-coumarate--CoA ligase
MKGYFKNEAATKETIDSDGYLHTGDIGYYDDDYCLVIVDRYGWFDKMKLFLPFCMYKLFICFRIKELIKVKGLQVAPGELENLLRSHPEVGDVAVIGVPNERLGEAPRAYIVPKSNSLTEESIKTFVASKVAQHKHLAGGVEFIDEIPKAASGKILRRKLVELYKSNNPK